MVVSPEKKAEYNKRYYENHKEQIMVHNREALSPQMKSEYNKRYYEAHKEDILQKRAHDKMVIDMQTPPVMESFLVTRQEKKEDRQRRNKDYYKTHKSELKRKRALNKKKKEDAKKPKQTIPANETYAQMTMRLFN